MRLARVFLLSTLVALLSGVSTAGAEGWSLRNLVPSGNQAASKRKQPSVMKRLGNGTKKVVVGATDLVTLKWLTRNKKQSPPKNHWVGRAKRHEKTKGSLLDYILPPKKPPPPSTLEEWMSQKRMDP